MPHPVLLRALALLLLLPLVAPASPAHAQIRRCVTDDGSHVYTDRACKDLGATERVPRQGVAEPGGRHIRRDCSRNLRDLVFELTSAIDGRDVNRLAGIYHWPGTSSRTAYAIMGRLDAIVNRPLVDISPLQPPPPPTPVAAAPSGSLTWRSPGGPGMRVATNNPTRDADAALPDSVRAAVERGQQARRAPTGLVVDQTVANRITPLQTVFSLRRHLGCWWVSL
ncbi:hypothetical protein [Luteimonas kalidii]|uniref:DUF4124 domain-containing protein n=1 Tax=Luteimonas kalidii TaxID=3042025 RepID=A0ABT6JVA2_9GAMM|nr:hypothetical protein [Luteimonas kalidii]MDH5834604.1 hypothetical protein [Luteimonas kalidii]